MRNKVQLVWYAARYWYWWGLKDHRGSLCLQSITEDGAGVGTEPNRLCRVVTGEEYDKQMAAIEYFRKLGVAL